MTGADDWRSLTAYTAEAAFVSSGSPVVAFLLVYLTWSVGIDGPEEDESGAGAQHEERAADRHG